MTSFNYTNDKIIELDNAIGQPQYTSKILPEFANVLVDFSLETAVKIRKWELSKSLKVTLENETPENDTIVKRDLVKTFANYYGVTRLNLLSAKEIQAVELGYWSFGGNQIISEMYKELDKELYGYSRDGNIGLISGVTPQSVAITNGEQLVDTMIAKARALNLGLDLEGNAPVKVFLSGALAEIYGSNKYNQYKNINEMIPANIKVIELPISVNNTNRMDLASDSQNLIYRGKLPMIMTNGVETVTDPNTFNKVQGMQIGYQSASIDKQGDSVISVIKA